MPMLASTPGVQSSTDRKMGLFSSPALLLKGTSSGILLPMESKMFGFVRQDPTTRMTLSLFSKGWFRRYKRQLWWLQRALGHIKSRGVYWFAFIYGHFAKKFRNWTRKVYTEEPQVEINYDNSLGECLVDNQCLDDIFYFLECMAVGACSEEIAMLLTSMQWI